jgi:diguanylate cyclase (GGDEF)-like protein
MSSDDKKPAAGAPHQTAPLFRALDKSAQVHAKVKQAATALSAINAVLKDEIADGMPLAKIELALIQSEKVVSQVQQAAAELIDVNDALAKEIDERQQLEDRLTNSDRALSESRLREKSSSHNALHDQVTGLPNLQLFKDRLRNGLAQAKRHNWRLAVMFIDLDGFKSVNDTHGHETGDRVLQEVAKRLRANVRSGDTVSRRSGDEFLFLMLEVKDESGVEALAAKIVSNIAEVCEIDGEVFTVKASIGVALYPEDGCSTRELLKHADAAMYAAKQQQKGPVLFNRISQPQPAKLSRAFQ